MGQDNVSNDYWKIKMHIPFYIGTARADVIKLVWRYQIQSDQNLTKDLIISRFNEVIEVTYVNEYDFIAITAKAMSITCEINYAKVLDAVEDLSLARSSLAFIYPRLSLSEDPLKVVSDMYDFFSIATFEAIKQNRETRVIVPVDFDI